MTGRERVLHALRGIRTERPAMGEILVAPELTSKFSCAGLERVLSRLGADIAVLHIEECPSTAPCAVSFIEAGYFVFGLGPGPFAILVRELGWIRACRLIVKDPLKVRRMIQTAAKATASWVALAQEGGCDGIIIADDLAGSCGLLVSPASLKELYFPVLADLLGKKGADSMPFIFHSDGNILELIAPLMEAGFRGIHGLQPSAGITPEILGLEKWKNRVFWGNFEYEGRERLKSKEEVQAEIKGLLKRWADFPGYIFGSSGGLYGALSPETIEAAYEAVSSLHVTDTSVHLPPP